MPNRTFTLPVLDLTGGENKLSPITAMKSKYSRLMKNCYVSKNGAVKKVPGYAADSTIYSGINIRSGFEFRKSDGTVERILSGTASSAAVNMVFKGLDDAANTDAAGVPTWVRWGGGAALNDMTVSGEYTGFATGYYEIRIAVEGTPDTFQWRFVTTEIGFPTFGVWSNPVSITGAAQLISRGIYATFAATTGHTAGSNGPWRIYVYFQPPKIDMVVDETSFTGAANAYYEVIISDVTDGVSVVVDSFKWRKSAAVSGPWGAWSSAIPITGAYQTIDSGVKVKFLSTTGHLINSKWGIKALAAFSGTSIFKHTTSGGAITLLKHGLSSTNLVRFAQMSDELIIANGSDRALFYDGNTINDMPLPLTWGATFAGLGLNDLTLENSSFSGLSDYIPSYTVEIESESSSIMPSASLDDMTASGTFTGTEKTVYFIKISTAGGTDYFQWSKNGGTYSAEIAITGGDHTIDAGVIVKFAATTGHTAGDYWAISVGCDIIKYRRNRAAGTDGWRQSTNSNYREYIESDHNDILDGIRLNFDAITGHTTANAWTINCLISSTQIPVFSAPHVHKGRMWLIDSNNKMTTYYSALDNPHDLTTADNAGYIDFTLVMPQGDTLTDIASYASYIVFFFRNNILIYSGTSPISTGDFAIYQHIQDTGVVGPNTVSNLGSDLLFLSPTGVKTISQVANTGSMEIGDLSELIDQDIMDSVKANTSEIYSACHNKKQAWYMLLVGTTVYIYAYQYKAWSRIIPPNATTAKILCMFTSQDGQVYMGGQDYLFKYGASDSVFTFNGVNPALEWQTGWFKITDAKMCFPRTLEIDFLSYVAEAVSVKVNTAGLDIQTEYSASFNTNSTSVPSTVYGDGVINKIKLPIGGQGNIVNFTFTNTGSGSLEINSLKIGGLVGA